MIEHNRYSMCLSTGLQAVLVMGSAGGHVNLRGSLPCRPSVAHCRWACRVDPTMAAGGARAIWCLRPSPAQPRTPTSVAGAGGARALLLAAGSHPDDRN